jgi:hypothetical protein
MIDPENVPPVAATEMLARYVTHHSQFRSSDGKVKPVLFMPYSHTELSVTRHLDATEVEIGLVGVDVAKARNMTFYGRSDIRASDCIIDSLQVTEKPLKKNPNHADIEGWPSEKENQKAIALVLAASASELIPHQDSLS